MIDRARVIEKLRLDFGYSQAGAESLASGVTVMPDSLRVLAEVWLDDGTETDYAFDEFTVFGLMKEKGFNYLNALNVLAWLMREPEKARQALSRRIDRVVIRRKK